jgi:hypothetical protein
LLPDPDLALKLLPIAFDTIPIHCSPPILFRDTICRQIALGTRERALGQATPVRRRWFQPVEMTKLNCVWRSQNSRIGGERETDIPYAPRRRRWNRTVGAHVNAV